MMDLFYKGGPLFMGILTTICAVMIGVAIINGMLILKGTSNEANANSRRLAYIKSVGLFALVVGLLGQLIGLYSAFSAIELHEVDVSPAMLAGGFKVSMITTLYGLIIYALSLIIWMLLSVFLKRNDQITT